MAMAILTVGKASTLRSLKNEPPILGGYLNRQNGEGSVLRTYRLGSNITLHAPERGQLLDRALFDDYVCLWLIRTRRVTAKFPQAFKVLR